MFRKICCLGLGVPGDYLYFHEYKDSRDLGSMKSSGDSACLGSRNVLGFRGLS